MRAPLLAVLAALLCAAPAGAAEIAVDSTAPGLGNCAVPGSCTLRQALADAKTLPGRDTIRVPPGTYDQTGPDLIVSIGEQVDIVGEDPRTTIIREVSGGDGRVFLVEQNAVLDLSGVTVTGSRDASAVLLFGANITFRATNVIFTQNTAANGGAIDATGGSVTLVNTTIHGNTATGKGGGVYLGGAGSQLAAHNTTIAGNAAPDGAGIAVDQGAATLRATTLAQNAGSADLRGAATLHASVVGTCAGAVTSLGGNAAGDAACALGGAGDRTAPLALGALADHGGTTPTLLPTASSPAIDADPACAAGATDQRGVARPQGAACDAGAVELTATPPAATPIAAPPAAVRITRLRVTPARWRIGARAARISFRSSAAATVRFTVQRARPGRQEGGRCAAPSRRNARGARCTRFVAVRGAFTRRARPGANTVAFRGTLAGRRLTAGRYRLVARIQPAGPTARAGFHVLAPRRR